jgi:hypothetical protein
VSRRSISVSTEELINNSSPAARPSEPQAISANCQFMTVSRATIVNGASASPT